MIFGLVQAITFDAFGTLNSARKSGMSPFPTVFILWDTRVHISSFYSGDIPSYIEALIDQTLCFASALDIPNVNPNDRHVWLRWDFNDLQFQCKYDVVENLVLLDDILNITRSEMILRIVMREVWNAYNFQIGLGLWESRGTSTHRELISSTFLIYCSVICKSNYAATLLVTTIIPKGSDQIKSARTLDFAFLSDLFMLATCKELFFMNFELFLLLIGMMLYFLDRSLVVIWIQGFTLELFLTILLIWSILFALRDRKASLILIISKVLVPCFKIWAYNFWGCLDILASLMFLKYLEIWSTSFCDLAGIGGDFLYTCQGWFVIDLIILIRYKWNFQSEFCQYFLSKSIRIFVSIEWVPISLIDRRYEVPNFFTYTMEILNIIELWGIDLFIWDILGYEVEGIFNALGIRH